MLQLIVIASIILAFIAISHIRRQPAEKRRSLTLKYSLYALLAIVVVLVITGRMHWLAAAIAAIFPILQRLLPWVLRLLPFIKKPQAQQEQTPPPSTTGKMDLSQALDIFGFKEVPSEKEIVQRHRELIQKNHPDRGGSDYLAAQINEARDVLLSACKTA